MAGGAGTLRLSGILREPETVPRYRSSDGTHLTVCAVETAGRYQTIIVGAPLAAPFLGRASPAPSAAPCYDFGRYDNSETVSVARSFSCIIFGGGRPQSLVFAASSNSLASRCVPETLPHDQEMLNKIDAVYSHSTKVRRLLTGEACSGYSATFR